MLGMRYVIYAIVDPRTNAFLYIGHTGSFWQRVKLHFVPNKCNGSKATAALLAIGVKPRIRILERAKTKKAADYKETKWIHFAEASGHPLFNYSKTVRHYNRSLPNEVPVITRSIEGARHFSPAYAAACREWADKRGYQGRKAMGRTSPGYEAFSY